MNSSLKDISKEGLIEMVNKLTLEADSFKEEANHFKQQNEYLQFQIDQLKRLVFGTKRERFIKENNPHQQSLPFAEFSEEDPELTQTVKETVKHKPSKKRENHQGRLALPSHLPVKETIIEPEGDVSNMICIGKEITEQLELIPGELFIQRLIRPKYALPKKEQEALIEKGNDQSPIIIADLPSMPIERCMAGTGLLSQMFIDKFIDHLPYYRQIQRYKREGVHIKSSTIDGWQSRIITLLEPLYECLKQKVLSQGYIQADESPVKVMDAIKKSKTHQGYHWVYHTPIEKILFFDYRQSRKRAGPELVLENFKGYLQTDGYAAYQEFNNKKDITLIGCMAHARRYFEKALDNDKSRAEYVLSEIQKLYAFERESREQDYDYQQRHEFRLNNARPIMEDLIKWLIRELPNTTPKSPIGIAIRYTIKQWESLRAYLYDGAIEIDNNQIENAIRPLAIGRKNYLFAGSHNGAKRAAMFYSFFGTCKKHNVNPNEWLKYVLDNIADTKMSELEELLPQRFRD